MPTQTFFNLPEEKRERIIDAAIKEFSEFPFHKASIARIIEEAEIPRGSFYQYFADLKDLYKHIFDVIGNEKIKYLYNIMDSLDEMATFKVIKEMYIAGIKFAMDHPKLAAVGNNFFREDDSFKREIFGDAEEKSLDFFENFLVRGQKRGEVKKDIDVKIAAFMIHTLNMEIFNYYQRQNKESNPFHNLEAYLKLIEKMLTVLEGGLRTEKKEVEGQ